MAVDARHAMPVMLAAAEIETLFITPLSAFVTFEANCADSR
jgi:hypothetical protein